MISFWISVVPPKIATTGAAAPARLTPPSHHDNGATAGSEPMLPVSMPSHRTSEYLRMNPWKIPSRNPA